MNKSRTRVHFRGHSLKVDTVLLNGVISAENRNRKKKTVLHLYHFWQLGSLCWPVSYCTPLNHNRLTHSVCLFGYYPEVTLTFNG